jgi:hypothetical protein
VTEHRDDPAPSSYRVPQIGITIRHASSGSAAKDEKGARSQIDTCQTSSRRTAGPIRPVEPCPPPDAARPTSPNGDAQSSSGVGGTCPWDGRANAGSSMRMRSVSADGTTFRPLARFAAGPARTHRRHRPGDPDQARSRGRTDRHPRADDRLRPAGRRLPLSGRVRRRYRRRGGERGTGGERRTVSIFAEASLASTREFGAISGVSPRRPPGGRAPLSSRGGAIRNRDPSARRRAAEPMGTGRPASLRPAPLSPPVPFRQDVRPGWLRDGPNSLGHRTRPSGAGT